MNSAFVCGDTGDVKRLSSKTLMTEKLTRGDPQITHVIPADHGRDQGRSRRRRKPLGGSDPQRFKALVTGAIGF